MTRRTHRGRAAALAALVLACAPAAGEARTLETILQDDAQLLHRPEVQLRRSLQELRLLGVDRVRVTAGWSVLTREPDAARRPDFDATDPAAYEQERWRNLDRLLILARAYGLETMVDVGFFAPRWASRDRPGERGRTDVYPGHFRDFATAVARRYSGTFVIPRPVVGGPPPPGSDAAFLETLFGTRNLDSGPSLQEALGAGAAPDERAGVDLLEQILGLDGGTPSRALPKVDVFTLWNEPNHPGFLRPQWLRVDGRARPRSPAIYRALVREAYPAIKQVQPGATVLIGGTAAVGGTPGSGMGGVPPLRFVRELACVDRRLRPRERGSCAGFERVPGDGWAHHPYSLETAPGARHPRGRPDEVPIAELPRLARTLDRLVRMGRLGAGARRIWVTEYGYETDPPVDEVRWTPNDQARFLPWAEYLAWRVPAVRSYAQFLLRDLPPGGARVARSRRRAFGQWHSGLLFADGRPKWYAPDSFRAALVAERRGEGRMHFWLRLRLGAGEHQVVVERALPGSQRWELVRTVGPGGREQAASFAADGRAVSQRFGTVPAAGAQHYRLRYSSPLGWRVTPRVAPIRRVR